MKYRFGSFCEVVLSNVTSRAGLLTELAQQQIFMLLTEVKMNHFGTQQLFTYLLRASWSLDDVCELVLKLGVVLSKRYVRLAAFSFQDTLKFIPITLFVPYSGHNVTWRATDCSSYSSIKLLNETRIWEEYWI